MGPLAILYMLGVNNIVRDELFIIVPRILVSNVIMEIWHTEVIDGLRSLLSRKELQWRIEILLLLTGFPSLKSKQFVPYDVVGKNS